MFWNDQTSCVYCQNVMSKHLESSKHTEEISVDELKHHRKPCYRNTKENPATVEEPTMCNIGKHCIIDPDSGKLWPNDEVILGSMMIKNSDSKGGLGFLQNSLQS